MRPNRRFAVLVLAVLVVIGLIVTSPWDSGEDHSKEALLGRVSGTLEEQEAPPQLTKCFVDALAKHLTEDEVQSAYDTLPDGAEDKTGLGVVESSPALRGEVSKYGLLCLQRLVGSDKYTPDEMARILRKLAL